MFTPVLVQGFLLLTVEGFLKVVFVNSVFKVFSGVRTARFLSGLSAIDGLDSIKHQILELKGLDQVRVPDQATIRNLDVMKGWPKFRHFLTAFRQHGPGAENGSVILHSFLHLKAELSSSYGTISEAKFVQVGNRALSSVLKFKKKTYCRESLNNLLKINYVTWLSFPMVSDGLFSSAIVKAQARPKTTKSKRELAPRRLAP